MKLFLVLLLLLIPRFAHAIEAHSADEACAILAEDQLTPAQRKKMQRQCKGPGPETVRVIECPPNLDYCYKTDKPIEDHERAEDSMREIQNEMRRLGIPVPRN